MSVRRVLALYMVVFVGFVGYSLMIAIFTPLILRPDGGMLPRDESTAGRAIALGVVLALYPLGGEGRRRARHCDLSPGGCRDYLRCRLRRGAGGALGTNQSMQVGAEALAGLVGGALAAIATALPLSTMAGLALVASAAFWMTPATG